MRPDDARRILTEEEPERPDASARAARPTLNARKPLLWIAALICLALLAATGAERWTLLREQQTIAQTRIENTRIQRDMEQTRQAVSQAQTPGAIEREARNLGYIRPGDTPVIIAQPHP
jgi:cell division protein FtsB